MMVPPPQQYHLASMVAQLSSTGLSHHSLLPHIPPIPGAWGEASPRRGAWFPCFLIPDFDIQLLLLCSLLKGQERTLGLCFHELHPDFT